MLDGTPFPYTAVGSFKLFEVTKYHTEVNITNATFGLIMNKDKYKSLDRYRKNVLISSVVMPLVVGLQI